MTSGEVWLGVQKSVCVGTSEPGRTRVAAVESRFSLFPRRGAGVRGIASAFLEQMRERLWLLYSGHNMDCLHHTRRVSTKS